jgi:hypothetical protein
MLDHLNSQLSAQSPASAPLILEQKAVKRCHIYLPDTPKPVSAILYKGQFYSYVKFFPSSEAAQRAAERLILRGNPVILTRIAKGLVLWVLELEAQWPKAHSVK